MHATMVYETVMQSTRFSRSTHVPFLSSCSMRNSSVQNLQIDAFTQRILEHLAGRLDVVDVELSPEGLWRPVTSGGGSSGGSNSEPFR